MAEYFSNARVSGTRVLAGDPIRSHIALLARQGADVAGAALRRQSGVRRRDVQRVLRAELGAGRLSARHRPAGLLPLPARPGARHPGRRRPAHALRQIDGRDGDLHPLARARLTPHHAGDGRRRAVAESDDPRPPHATLRAGTLPLPRRRRGEGDGAALPRGPAPRPETRPHAGGRRRARSIHRLRSHRPGSAPPLRRDAPHHRHRPLRRHLRARARRRRKVPQGPRARRAGLDHRRRRRPRPRPDRHGTRTSSKTTSPPASPSSSAPHAPPAADGLRAQPLRHVPPHRRPHQCRRLYTAAFENARDKQTLFAARNVRLAAEATRANALAQSGKLDEAAALVRDLAAATPDPHARRDLEAQAAQLEATSAINHHIITYNEAIALSNKGETAKR